MTRPFFITATDTDAGKTVVSTALLKAAEIRGLSTLALKPVAAGCEQTKDGLRNDDALKLIEAMSVTLPYEQVNPLALVSAIAPHIAAQQEGRTLSVSRIVGYCRGALLKKADFSLIEGAGGWRVPLSHREMMSGIPRELECPVILVVPLKLGCINHALLTTEAIYRDGLTLAGWVGNHPDPSVMSCEEENLQTLNALLPAPCLGVLPWLPCPDAMALAEYINLDLLESVRNMHKDPSQND